MKYCSHTIFYCPAEARRRRPRGKLTERSLVSPEQCSGFKIAQTNSPLPWSYRLSGIVHSAVMLCLSTGSKNNSKSSSNALLEPGRMLYLASGVSDTGVGLVRLVGDLAGDVATSFLGGFKASV